MITITFVFRISGQSSLKVSPSIRTSDPFILDTSEPLAKALTFSRLSRLKGNQTGLPGKDLTKTEDLKDLSAVYKVSSSINPPLTEEYTVAKNAINVKLFEDGKDKIGQQVHKEVDTIDDTLENESFFSEAFDKQLIPFSISNITPEKSFNLFFHAFLDDYTDTYSGNWNPQQYIGRGEEFYTYNNFTRAINFSFKAASFNKDSLLVMYNKLNLLAGATAPSYSDGGSFMRGTLTRITIGDLLYRQTGFISSLGLSWNNSYQWELSNRDGEEIDKLPHVLDVSVQFTPIHNFNVKSDLNLNDEKYFGKRTKQETKKEEPIRPVINTTTPTFIAEETKLDLTPPAALPDLSNIGGYSTPISDTAQFTTTGFGLDTIGTGEQRKKGRAGGYIED